MKRLWEFGIPLIGGKALTMKQFDGLLKDIFVDPIARSVNLRPDWLHVLQRGLFDMHGKQIPIEEKAVWSKIPDDARDRDEFVFEVW